MSFSPDIELSTRNPSPTHVPWQDGHRPIRKRGGWMHYALLHRKWKPHPYWLFPAVFIVYVSRGATVAPRIQVINAIACRALRNVAPIARTRADSHPPMDCSGSDVAAKAAQIQAATATIMSILSAVTTGFWSRLGDVYGRKAIFMIFLLGAMCIEVAFILVMRPEDVFNLYAVHLLLLGSALEGLVGGVASFHAVIHVYISDCTPHGSRSNIFSIIQGIVYVGLSIGPWFAGLVIPPNASLDRFFYIGLITIVITLIYMLLICPESYQPVAYTKPAHSTNQGPHVKSIPAMMRGYVVNFFASLASPIAIFAPRPLKGSGYRERKSYSLTFLGLALFVYRISHGAGSNKYLFAQHLYSWTTAQLGYFLSLLWITKAVALLVLLPIAIFYLKPRTGSVPGTFRYPHDLAAELRFDRRLAQFSFTLDAVSDVLVALTSQNSETMFVLFSCATSFTSGGDPALHSLGAVCLHACGYSSEVGALFGAKAVLTAVAAMIAPSIFAWLYGATVAYFPQAIFVLAAALAFASVVLLVGVKVSTADIMVVHAAGVEEVPLNETAHDDEEFRDVSRP